MADAPSDDNFHKALLGVSNADGVTPVVLWADPTTHRLLTSTSITVNTEYAEDTAASAGDEGTFILAVRQDSAASLVGTDGDYTGLQVDANGALRVTGGGGGTEYTEDAAVPANPVGTAIMMERDDVLGGITPAAGDWTHPFATAEGALWVQDFNSDAILADTTAILADTAAMDTNLATLAGAVTGTEVQVDIVSGNVTNAGTFVVQIDGDALTALQLIDDVVYAEDAASAGGDKGVMILARRTATPADTSGTDLDYESLQMDNGRLWVSATIDAALPAGTNAIGKLAANDGVDIGDVDVTSITGLTMANGAAQITGDEAHDAADAGGPVKIGGRAQVPTAAPDEVADNDRVDGLFDLNGRLAVWAGSDYKYADINDSTSGNNTIIAAGGAGKRIAVWAWDLISDGTVDARWEDGAGGTAFSGQYPFQAREGIARTAGGLVPLFVGSANTLLNLELSATINVHGSVSYTLIDD